MKITWLGQAGLLFEKNGFKIMVDPYLSNYVETVEPLNYRRMPIDKSFFDIEPDILLITHNHIDHLDPETVKVLLEKNKTGKKITVLAPYNAWCDLRKYGNAHNYVMFNRHTQWSQNGIIFKAVKAEHSDLTAIGSIIQDGDKNYYISGDTLYSTDVIDDIEQHPDVAFLPINGVGNNMNITDAIRFAKAIDAKKVVPLHFGMFDEINPENFSCTNMIIPKIYRQITLE